MGAFFLGFLVCLVLFVVFAKMTCGHHNTEYVTKCIDCGKVFNDGLSELRKRS